MSINEDIYEALRLELRRGSLILAVLGLLRAEHYGYTLRKALAAQGVVHRPPFALELPQRGFAIAREAVEALVALVFFAPDAGQQPLAVEPAQHRIEGALVDLHALGRILKETP